MIFNEELGKALSLLEITTEVSTESIKKAYYQKAKKHHPDLFLGNKLEADIAEQKMKKINEAKDLIDNFVDQYGIRELTNIYENIKASLQNDLNKNNLDETEEITIYTQDPDLFVDEAITTEFLRKRTTRIYNIFCSSTEKHYSNQQRFILLIRKALNHLKKQGYFVVADQLSFHTFGNAYIHDPLCKRCNTSDKIYISRYHTPTIVKKLDKLLIDEGSTTTVTIEPTRKAEMFSVVKDGYVLCQLQKCDSFIEYLLKNEVIQFKNAQLYRGIAQTSIRRNGSKKTHIEDNILDYYFVPHQTEWNISELETIEKGFYFQKNKLSAVHHAGSLPMYPVKKFSNVIEQLDAIFLHHQAVVPTTKRLGMMYFSFSDHLVYTPSEIPIDFFIENNISSETFKEMFQIMVVFSTITSGLTSDIAKQYIFLRGNAHYHIGNRIISLMTFRKSAGNKYSGIHIRFYHKTENMHLYSLPSTNGL